MGSGSGNTRTPLVFFKEMKIGAQVMPKHEEIIDFLREEAEECIKMSAESKKGGWSTHQCKPLESKAVRLYSMVIRILEEDID